MTNPDGNAGETPPSEPNVGPSEPSSSGYEAPPIEHSQDRPTPAETQPTYELPPSYSPGPPAPPSGYAPPQYPGTPAYAPPPPVDPIAPLDYPSSGAPPPPGYPPPPSYPGAGYGGYPYQPYQADPYDPYLQNRPPGTNGMAIASLACSIAGLLCCLPAIVGLILGIMAMRDTRRTGQEGYGIALAGAIIGGIVTAGTVLYLVIVLVVAAAGGL